MSSNAIFDLEIWPRSPLPKKITKFVKIEALLVYFKVQSKLIIWFTVNKAVQAVKVDCFVLFSIHLAHQKWQNSRAPTPLLLIFGTYHKPWFLNNLCQVCLLYGKG